jgi:hypothetical protein
MTAPASWVAVPELCFACGRETGVGTKLLAQRSRLTRSDGSPAFICADCIDRMCSAAYREALASENLIEAVVASLPNVIL